MRAGLARLNVRAVRCLRSSFGKGTRATFSHSPLAVALADRVHVAARAAVLRNRSADIAFFLPPHPGAMAQVRSRRRAKLLSTARLPGPPEIARNGARPTSSEMETGPVLVDSVRVRSSALAAEA
jgi:hypothetical protein